MLGLIGLLTGPRFGTGVEHAEFMVTGGSSGPVVTLINHVARENVSLALNQHGLAVETGFAVHGSQRVTLSGGGISGSVTPMALSAALAGAGEGRSVSTFLDGSSLLGPMAVEMLAVTAGTTTWLYAARPGGEGIGIFRANGTGQPEFLSQLADTPGTYAAGVSAMTSFAIDGETYLAAGSRGEGGVTVFLVGEDGELIPTDSLGIGQLVPLPGLESLRAVQAGGETYLLAAASGNSSLTVLRVDDGGLLSVADHVQDSLDTRFQSARCIDVITVKGWTFVLAAGADDGLTLMVLLPGGRLLHLETLADTAAAGLGNVTALRMVHLGDSLQILTVSGAEAGLTVLEIDLSQLGVAVAWARAGGTLAGAALRDLLVASEGIFGLSGGGGDDILVDGPGSQVLTGGAGADVFVMVADGAPDTIMDFDRSRDRIDLSLLPGFRNASQLEIAATSNGAILRFGGEELTIVTANGRPLTEAQVWALDFGIAAQRVPVEPGIPEIPPEEPVEASPGRTRLDGTSGHDLLTGGTAGEDFHGGSGNDTFAGGGGDDRFYGGAGFDIVSYEGLAQGIVLDRSSPALQSAEVRDDLFSAIEGFIGTAYGDVLIGSEAAEWLSGGDGNDSINGKGGKDSLFGGNGNDELVATAGANRMEGGDGNDTLLAWNGHDSMFGGGGDDLLDGKNGKNLLDGGDGNDRINGGAGEDTAYGGAGNDRIALGDGDNLAEGGAGDDVIETGKGNDIILGGDGHDWIVSGAGDDQIWGGDGDDGIASGAGNDTVHGGDGHDGLNVDAGDDLVWAGAGNDNVAGGAGNDTIYGEDGDDNLGGGEGHDRLYGGAGQDVIGGGPGNDLIHAGDGDDVASGGWGRDSVYGGSGNDTLAGSYDPDIVHGGDGDDSIGGGTGNDTIQAGPGNDQVGAGEDNDLVHGEEGDDFLGGGPGNDTLYGGSGDDTLNGGTGNDWLYGGEGCDTFVFRSFERGETGRIADYDTNLELIRLVGVGGMPALKIHDSTLSGVRGAMIDVGGYHIFLDGVSAATLDATDFLFY